MSWIDYFRYDLDSNDLLSNRNNPESRSTMCAKYASEIKMSVFLGMIEYSGATIELFHVSPFLFGVVVYI